MTVPSYLLSVDGAGIREGMRSYSVYGKQTLDDAVEGHGDG